MNPTRRTFLTVGLLGSAVLAIGGVGLALRATALRQPRRPLQALTPEEFSVMAAVAERMIVGEGLIPASELEVAEDVDAVLATLHPAALGEVKQVLALLENALAGLILDGRVTTFTGSPPEVQDRVLASWSGARIDLFRTAYRALHTLCMATYWSHRGTYAQVAYPGPPPLYGLLDPDLRPGGAP